MEISKFAKKNATEKKRKVVRCLSNKNKTRSQEQKQVILTTRVLRQRVPAGARGLRAAAKSHTLILLNTRIANKNITARMNNITHISGLLQLKPTLLLLLLITNVISVT